jgi:acid phosphatase
MPYRPTTAIESLESRRLFAAGIPRPDHVVVVIEENHSYSNIIASADAPYFNALASQGALFTQHLQLMAPSQPNYIALFSGSPQGVHDNNVPYTFTAPSLGGQLIARGLDFAGYSEDLPSVGWTGKDHLWYRRRHNPWVDFTDVPATDNLPFTLFPKPADFSKLPTVSFVIPNLLHDMHNGTVKAADDWLKTNLDPYVQWAKTHNSLLIVTYDETDHKTDMRMPTTFVGPMVKAGKYAETINHYNLLRTIEDMYGLSHLANAATAAPITDVWKTSTPAPKTTHLLASADTFEWDKTPTTNYGASTGLDVKTNTSGLNRDAFLKFDTGSAAGTVTSAKLRFYGKLSAAGTMNTGVYSVPKTTWSESTATWANSPKFSALLGSIKITSTTGGWYELDLTNYVKAERAAGHNTISVGLHSLGFTAAKLSVNSREAASNRPELVVTSG